MVDTRLPLLRGKITSVDTYEAPQPGRGSRPAMPSLDPKAHRSSLIQQLNAITQQVNARTEHARDELAKREIVAVRPAAGAQLAADQLDDAKADARLVGVTSRRKTSRTSSSLSRTKTLRRSSCSTPASPRGIRC